ncbi:SDR family NAD(P)-dependent oxidoreductase [Enhygromyxa salina]|uniref:SDR family NAD(P)-dependent oxidoreductase n=1 Tax=Enhygromyxa salina TaxID=215803 RepID=UPI002158D6E3|nr:SDR family oxidoreductase [Enhygromyxa salina]
MTGASRGLGLGVARSLAVDHGLGVALVAREQTALDAAVAQLRAAGAEVIGIVADVSDKRAIHRIVGQAAAALGDIDVLVNNASSLGPTPLRALLDSECEDFGGVLETNLLGPFRLTKAVLGSMVLRGRGVAVQISSDAAVEAYPEWGLYGVSKAALDHLARIWAAELDGTGVRMLSVDPGEMNTRMHADAIPDADPSTLADPDAVGRVLAAMILEREGAPSGARLSAASWSTTERDVA